MNISRRTFLMGAAGAVAASSLRVNPLLAATGSGLRLGACDWSMGLKNTCAFEAAKTIGLDGIEVFAGDAAEVLKIAQPETQKEYNTASKATGIEVASVALGLMNNYPLAKDERGPAWLAQAIQGATALEAKVILIAFFGAGDLRKHRKLKTDDVDIVVERIKEAAPLAEKAGVVLGLENTLSAQDNMMILDRIQSDAVRVYYDICNATNYGYNVPEEIRQLGDRICQIHLKENKCLLGEGKVDMAGVQKSVEAIDYKGWLVLETPILNNDMQGSFSKNAAYAKTLFNM